MNEKEKSVTLSLAILVGVLLLILFLEVKELNRFKSIAPNHEECILYTAQVGNKTMELDNKLLAVFLRNEVCTKLTNTTISCSMNTANGTITQLMNCKEMAYYHTEKLGVK